MGQGRNRRNEKGLPLSTGTGRCGRKRLRSCWRHTDSPAAVRWRGRWQVIPGGPLGCIGGKPQKRSMTGSARTVIRYSRSFAWACGFRPARRACSTWSSGAASSESRQQTWQKSPGSRPGASSRMSGRSTS